MTSQYWGRFNENVTETDTGGGGENLENRVTYLIYGRPLIHFDKFYIYILQFGQYWSGYLWKFEEPHVHNNIISCSVSCNASYQRIVSF